MASKSKKRRSSGQLLEASTPVPRQKSFTPQTRSVKSRNCSSSAQKLRQQTITQIHHEFYHPGEDIDDLAYDEYNNHAAKEPSRRKTRRSTIQSRPAYRPEESLTQRDFLIRQESNPEAEDVAYEEEHSDYEEAPPSKSKRRKTGQNHAVQTGQTRSRRRQSTKETVKKGSNIKEKARPSSIDDAPQSRADEESTLMPPPKTPKSCRRKEIPSSQSPADTPLSIQSRRSIRGISRSPLKERSTNIPTRIPVTVKGVQSTPKLEIADSMEYESEDISVSMRTPMAAAALHPREGSRGVAAQQVLNTSIQRTRGFKSEIFDSDSDDDTDLIHLDFLANEDDEEYEPDSSSKANLKSRDASRSLQTSLNSSNNANVPHAGKSTAGAREELQISEPEVTTGRKKGTDAYNEQQSSSTANNTSTIENPATRSAPTTNSDTLPHPKLSKLPDSLPNPITRSPSSEASAQLTADLTRLTQLPTTQRTPIQPFKDHSSPSSLPPSQTTTVDITQPSSCTHKQPHQLTSPSPPFPPIFSSSPVRSPKTRRWTELLRGWNGVSLTDSQLLPDSLMNDTLPEPPPMTQESWDGGDV